MTAFAGAATCLRPGTRHAPREGANQFDQLIRGGLQRVPGPNDVNGAFGQRVLHFQYAQAAAAGMTMRHMARHDGEEGSAG